MLRETDLVELWKRLDTVRYLVMRNYDNIIEDLNNGGDLDLLVDRKDDVIIATKACPMVVGDNCYNYKISIAGNEIPVDLRVVGDGYYDRFWESQMLDTRKRRGEFYIMDSENYMYSILYHCIIHKKHIPDKYLPYLHENGIDRVSDLISALDNYMLSNGYDYVIPRDKGIGFNRWMYLRRKLSCKLNKKNSK